MLVQPDRHPKKSRRIDPLRGSEDYRRRSCARDISDVAVDCSIARTTAGTDCLTAYFRGEYCMDLGERITDAGIRVHTGVPRGLIYRAT